MTYIKILLTEDDKMYDPVKESLVKTDTLGFYQHEFERYPEKNKTPMEQANYYKSIDKEKNYVIITNSDYIVKSLAILDIQDKVEGNSELNIQLYNNEGELLNKDKNLYELDEIDYFDKAYTQMMKEFTYVEAKLHED